MKTVSSLVRGIVKWVVI